MEEFYSFNCSEETECEFWIVNKDFLRAVIKDSIKNTAEYYKEQQTTIKKIVEHLKDPTKVSVEDIMGKPETEDESWEEYEARQKARESVGDIYSNINRKADEWGGYFGIESHLYIDEPIDKRDGMLTRSWTREYSVFNLLYIYNTFDWENDYLIYNAW
jgi:ribosomal protein S10